MELEWRRQQQQQRPQFRESIDLNLKCATIPFDWVLLAGDKLCRYDRRHSVTHMFDSTMHRTTYSRMLATKYRLSNEIHMRQVNAVYRRRRLLLAAAIWTRLRLKHLLLFIQNAYAWCTRNSQIARVPSCCFGSAMLHRRCRHRRR